LDHFWVGWMMGKEVNVHIYFTLLGKFIFNSVFENNSYLIIVIIVQLWREKYTFAVYIAKF